MSSTDQTPHYFATKHDSAAHEVIALLADETDGYGMREDSSGDVDSPTGWFALVTIPEDVDLSMHDANPTEVADLAGTYGVTPEDVAGTHLVFHDSHGFVSVDSYVSWDEAKARERFDCLRHQYDVWSQDEWNDGDPLDDGDGGYVCPVPGHGYHSVNR